MRIAAEFVRAYARTQWRGSTRIPALLARHLPSLHAVPIQICDWPPVYVDLRFCGMEWLTGSPWPECPEEPAEQSVMRRFLREGQIAYDIGAHFGVHSVLISQLVAHTGRAIAFEPNPRLAPCLRMTLAQLPNADFFPLALSDRKGECEFFVPADYSCGSLRNWTGTASLRLTCELQTLDSLHLPRPDFIKCDVEGAELSVLRGARETLDREDAPVILYEANADTARGFGLNIRAAAEFLASLQHARYRFSKVLEDGTLGPLDGSNCNILAVPGARS